MTDTTRLTIHELQEYRDAIVGKDYDGPKLLPIRITEQLIATMQREVKLREFLNWTLYRLNPQVSRSKYFEIEEWLNENPSEYPVGGIKT